MIVINPLQLKCGNPELIDNPASFSRFVLPFAYRLGKPPNQRQGLCYEAIKEVDQTNNKQRSKYLTNETALVLFERAKWFKIKEDDWQKTPWGKRIISVKLKTGKFEIKMLPPTLVLFEFPKKPKEKIKRNSTLQIGFLYVDIYFPLHKQKPILDDLLKFNELFRYFDMPYEEHIDDYKECLGNIPVEYPIHNGIYSKIENMANNDFQGYYFNRWLNLLKIPIKYNGQYYSLISDDSEEEAIQWISNATIQKSSKTENSLIHVDNRCYVWTAVFIKGGGSTLNSKFNGWIADKLLAHNFGHWVKLLNIDLPSDTPEKTHKSISEFEKEWANVRTYKRWQHFGTWYGFNYHSGVMLADISMPYLCTVFRGQYFDQTLLLLYLRTALFNFSRELSLIIHEQESVVEEIRQLRKEFSRFAILYQFPSLSNQQQAIEMYTLARKCLDIDELYREVQEEINNAHDFLEQLESNKLGNAANTLAKWGVPIGAASVVATLMSVYKSDGLEKCLDSSECQLWTEFSFQIFPVLSIFVLAFVITSLINDRTNK